VHSLGDVTNWMNSTTGEFNYTGLVANMEMKAGMFYGMNAYLFGCMFNLKNLYPDCS
jgi:hypothetical protein